MADEVFFAFIALILGLLTRIFLAWTHVPYTVVMLVSSEQCRRHCIFLSQHLVSILKHFVHAALGPPAGVRQQHIFKQMELYLPCDYCISGECSHPQQSWAMQAIGFNDTCLDGWSPSTQVQVCLCQSFGTNAHAWYL